MISDFKTWWNQSEIFGPEGIMSSAEEAWDYRDLEITYWKEKYLSEIGKNYDRAGIKE